MSDDETPASLKPSRPAWLSLALKIGVPALTLIGTISTATIQHYSAKAEANQKLALAQMTLVGT